MTVDGDEEDEVSMFQPEDSEIVNQENVSESSVSDTEECFLESAIAERAGPKLPKLSSETRSIENSSFIKRTVRTAQSSSVTSSAKTPHRMSNINSVANAEEQVATAYFVIS